MSGETYRVLVIEDVPADVRLLEEELAAADAGLFRLEVVSSLSDGLERLADGGMDLVLLDLKLPDSSGLETFISLREHSPTVPVVVLSGTDDVSVALDAVREGAQDYLVKGQADGDAIVRAVRYAIERKRAHLEATRRAAELEALRATGLEMAARLEPEALLRLVAQRGMELVAGDAGGLYMHRKEEATLEWAIGVGEHVTAPGSRLRRGEGLAGVAWDKGETVVADDYRQWGRRAKSCRDCRMGSVVATPVVCRDAVLGVLVVGYEGKDGVTASAADLLELLATQAAVAIDNARLYGELRLRAEQLEMSVRQRTAELRSQAAQAEAILRSSADGIVVTDSEGAVLTANPVVEEWLGQTLSDEDAARLREVIGELAVQAEKRPEATLALKGLDLEMRAAPVSEQAAGQAAAVVNIHDVTHLHALNRMRSRFVSDVSHELRTPVTAIKLYAELMRTQPERWQEFLETLAGEADRQGRLVGSILEISRIDAGRLELRPKIVELDDLAQGTMASHRPLAEAHGVTLKHTRARKGGPVANVDPERMSRALNNLVENAIWYTPKGGNVVVSTAAQAVDGRRWATLAVEDTGVGIPEDELPRVFERFYRGRQSREMQVPGSGLGLAIVKEIVELHGGKVTVESTLKKGSTFTIWVPAGERSE